MGVGRVVLYRAGQAGSACSRRAAEVVSGMARSSASRRGGRFPLGRIAHRSPVFVGTVIDPDEQDGAKQVAEHRRAAAGRRAI